LLELQRIRSWARDPNFYNDLASWSVYSLLARNFAPLKERINAAAQRLAAIPRLFSQAKSNLSKTTERATTDPVQGIPRIFVEIALRELAGAKSFLETVPPQLAEQTDEATAKKLLSENARAVDACNDFLKFLNDELLEKARGTFALGAATFRQLLAYQERVETPLEQILERGRQELRKTQEQMQQLGRQISDRRSLRDILDRLADEHPSPDDLIPSYKQQCDEIKKFVTERDIVTIPGEDDLDAIETPPFYRTLVFAALDCPGPFEKSPLPSFFYVTPVDPSRSHEEQEAYLRAHNSYAQTSTIIHEAYPGHYVQSLHLKRTQSRLRKIFPAGTFVEGWAHYCEEMMLDEGYGDGDPKLRLFQLHEALWRIGRLIAATLMHTAGFSMDEALTFLVRECYQEPENARREVWRYTRDPLVLTYSWGKWQIQSLRKEYQQRRGSQFSLKQFHDLLLSQGEPPLSLLRPFLLEERT